MKRHLLDTDFLIDLLNRLSFRDPESGCVMWLGKQNADGYGFVDIPGWMPYVHRIVWAMDNDLDYYEEIPLGKDVHHICGRRACFAPDHLVLVDSLEHRRAHLAEGREIWKRMREQRKGEAA